MLVDPYSSYRHPRLFHQDFLTLIDLNVGASQAGVRYYDTPGGRFPSVTTVIGAYKDKTGLVEWRKNVGDDEADHIVGQSQVRGRAVHLLAERYLKNDDFWYADAMPSNLASFLSIKDMLDRHVGRVFGIETPLWSSYLRTAGRTDLIAEWGGVPAIIDFKTSRRLKNEEKIWGYFVQKACYGHMAEELTGLSFPRIVTVMMTDHEPGQVWVKRRSDYQADVVRVFVEAPRVKELLSL